MIERGLLAKGFIKDYSDHKILRLVVNGKITRIRTKISFGSQHKDYGDTLLDCIKKQLHLGNKLQLLRLVDCTTEYEDYVAYLKTSGVCF